MPARVRTVRRVVAGLALVAGGVLALTAGTGALVAGALLRTPEANSDPAFVATLAPVYTSGYAVVVPDIGDVVAQHGLGRLLGDGRLTLTVRSVRTTDLIVVSLVPAVDAARYVSGTARTEVVAVGYALGAQPVETLDLYGHSPVGPPPWEHDPAVGVYSATVSLTVPTSTATALVVRRWDGQAGLTVAITAGLAPSSLGLSTTVLLICGLLALLIGLALLLLRSPGPDALLAEARAAMTREPTPLPPAAPPQSLDQQSPRIWIPMNRDDHAESPPVDTATWADTAT
jgi:hypothetical protein